jgi:hypothetical protein
MMRVRRCTPGLYESRTDQITEGKMKLALILLIAQVVGSSAGAPPVTSPYCYGGQAVEGQRLVVGQFPFFSCLERGADCQLHWVRCSPLEMALAVGLGGQVQNPRTIVISARGRR